MHFGDLETPSLPDEVIAYDRYPAKPQNRKACQCMLIAFDYPSDPEANEGLVGCHPAVNKEPAIASLNNFGFLPHIGNLTSDRLKEIGSGNYALDQAILVHDDRHPNRLGLEAIKCPENRHRFGKNQRLVDDRDRVERTAIYGLVEQILFAYDTDNLIYAAASKDKMVMTTVADRAQDLLQAVV